MKRKTVDSRCSIIIFNWYDFYFYYALNIIKSSFKTIDLLEHVKNNTLIIICHYSICEIYDFSKVGRSTWVVGNLKTLLEGCLSNTF